ncbi:MAG: hypothetical protein ABW221_24505 [Vicinamibacteria bacterium]
MGAIMRPTLSLALLTLATLACARGDRAEPRESVSVSSPVVGSSRVSARDESLPAAGLPAMCPEGKGDPQALCDGGVPGLHQAKVEAAIDTLLETRPELFDRERVIGHDGYKVIADDAFYQGVAGLLQAQGLCAVWNYSELQIKTSAAASESYVLLDPKSFIRRGDRSLSSTCVPAAFPLDPADVVDRVRVGFYGIRCEGERKPPRNGEGLLPLGCTGYVTATPKRADDTDVDRRVHGDEIDWQVVPLGGRVVLSNYSDVPFNKVVKAYSWGDVRLCATVANHQGCMNIKVVP